MCGPLVAFPEGYLSLQAAGSSREGGAVTVLQSTKTVSRLEFGSADFVALMMGVQDWGRWNHSLRASSERETSSANSWTEASSVRRRVRTPTTTLPVTPVVIGMTWSGRAHLWVVPYRSEVHTRCRSQEVSVNRRLRLGVAEGPGTERSISVDKPRSGIFGDFGLRPSFAEWLPDSQ